MGIDIYAHKDNEIGYAAKKVMMLINKLFHLCCISNALMSTSSVDLMPLSNNICAGKKNVHG
ncbi:hypothetical protein Ccrd_003072 [Cynara cardunculus var. scolymus]|uniref:Uncharacterized protein n=1 Tax=Cynara cardunculus var. scolymus TaxID=59895 RepID=A0A118JX21_CYNCS|nr:hypothetical protein Ccrd_003072 [Cynara cardunculus var. scolymus]